MEEEEQDKEEEEEEGGGEEERERERERGKKDTQRPASMPIPVRPLITMPIRTIRTFPEFGSYFSRTSTVLSARK